MSSQRPRPLFRPFPHRANRSLELAIGLAVASCGALLAPAAGAQVNVETLRSSIRHTGAGGKLDLSITTYQGNTRGTNLGASGLFGLRELRHLAYVHANGRYTHLGGEVSVANYFTHLRHNYELAPRLHTEALAQAESDRFRRLRLRQLLGFGARFSALNQPAAAVYHGLTYLFEYNRLADGEVPVRPDIVHRLGNYVSAVLDLDEERVVATTTLYYQPRFDALDDYRLLWVSSLEFRVVGYLSAGIHTTLRHESPVPAGVRPLDLTVTNTLGLTL